MKFSGTMLWRIEQQGPTLGAKTARTLAAVCFARVASCTTPPANVIPSTSLSADSSTRSLGTAQVCHRAPEHSRYIHICPTVGPFPLCMCGEAEECPLWHAADLHRWRILHWCPQQTPHHTWSLPRWLPSHPAWHAQDLMLHQRRPLLPRTVMCLMPACRIGIMKLPQLLPLQGCETCTREGLSCIARRCYWAGQSEGSQEESAHCS